MSKKIFNKKKRKNLEKSIFSCFFIKKSTESFEVWRDPSFCDDTWNDFNFLAKKWHWVGLLLENKNWCWWTINVTFTIYSILFVDFSDAETNLFTFYDNSSYVDVKIQMWHVSFNMFYRYWILQCRVGNSKLCIGV